MPARGREAVGEGRGGGESRGHGESGSGAEVAGGEDAERERRRRKEGEGESFPRPGPYTGVSPARPSLAQEQGFQTPPARCLLQTKVSVEARAFPEAVPGLMEKEETQSFPRSASIVAGAGRASRSSSESVPLPSAWSLSRSLMPAPKPASGPRAPGPPN